MTISPSQCRAARALVEMDQAELAAHANVSRNVIVDFEKARRTPNSNNLRAIKDALETAGVIFVDQNGDGPGVRRRRYRAGDIVRLRQAGLISGITVSKHQTGIVTIVELDVENLGENYRVTVRFDDVPLPVTARDLELIQPARPPA